MPSVEAYYKQIADAEAVLAEKKEVLEEKKRVSDDRATVAARKTEAVQIEERKFVARSAENPWLVSILASCGCLVAIGYFLWRRHVSNITGDQASLMRVSIFLGVVILLLVGVGFLRRHLKRKDLEKLKCLLQELGLAQSEATAEQEKAMDAYLQAKSEWEASKAKLEQLQAALYQEHPEEKRRIEDAEKAEIQRRLEEKAAQDAAYEQMLADNEARNQRLQLAGEMFDTPRKFLKEYGSEFAVLEAAAEMGCEEAQSKVVMVYVGAEYVSGVQVDVQKGLLLGRKYAGNKKEGSPMVAETLGEIYLFGKGDVEKDAEKAAEWLEQAAACGRKNAMVNLGYSYYAGEGVDADLEKATYWLERASKQGDEQAFRMLEAIKSGVRIQMDH